ncbi:geranylgeranylglycerol-phosphate geranylgeranyltransferase [Methanopyrus kandleri]|uniref:Digeranylgeranylglyceryl phosphate synthase n=2 Tax=Methanopyrus kandleri TaxID=2320 RepID=DGGGP_METKA|nr:geranylgeranylglycerol-phosphate geranylgeranyltransferase [Methanopyrus kandleri]Q8TWS9.1 RecName: Full=Digeranylgeranylglyceryl phosphate synthase; Short=DGGGP synthase; Short=DGGGPS; AltName: Full=(S)-2,3-di-O-geranylgeranylglyceryl phosphate synthase; AltName: Full=Geranylgeranylglycerol-phosphate geranylgeranyltransferase [Methanopyrus kandleri AV19]AAM02166.1 4-hydroxybenzoate polyprenyltransferase [Methanopyrus kandleri AV19]HII69815.1 geranylgeranylglycerol-phosphate geranylgeranyltra
MRAYLELARPINCAMAALGVVVGELIAGARLDVGAVLAPVVAAVVCAGGNAINDYFDAEVDAVNRPDRPIPSGRVSPRSARMFALGCFAVGVGMATVINRMCLAIAALNSVLLYLYSWRLKGTPLIGNVMVSYLVGSCFLFGAAVGQRPAPAVWLFLLAFLANLVREILKDLEDVEGDAALGLKTLPIAYGEGVALRVATVFAIALAVLTPLPYLDGVVGWPYLVLALPAAAVILLASVLAVAGSWDAGKAQRVVKVGMLLGLLAFLASLL